MNILFLAPQPFYQERGTPIAVDLAVRVLENEGHHVDLLTYPEGDARDFRTVRHFRTAKLPFVRNIPMGFSWKKVVYSFMMLFSALRLMLSNRYKIIHAVEEATFIGMILGFIFRKPYVYDMDSSLAGQLLDKKPSLEVIRPLLQSLESLAIRRARAVIAVCPALVELAQKYKAKETLLLTDISLLDRYKPGQHITDLRKAVNGKDPLFLYVGNLEYYQGIDLLLESWAEVQREKVSACLVVIGGRSDHISFYQKRCVELDISESVIFLGPRPVADLAAYLEQADVVVSPRIQGNNTPMKVYTYLDSGRPLLATAIDSHTQVLNDSFVLLVEPDPQSMGQGIITLAKDPVKRKMLAERAKEQVERLYSYNVFYQKLAFFYNEVDV